MLSVRVPGELLAKLDAYRATRRPIPPRAEVVRAALEAFLSQDKQE